MTILCEKKRREITFLVFYQSTALEVNNVCKKIELRLVLSA